MDAAITDLLDTIGVDADIQARLALFSDVEGPNTEGHAEDAVQAFTDATPVTVTLTAGQVVLLRGGLRFAVQGVMQSHAQKVMMDGLFGLDPTEGFIGGGPNEAYRNYLDCEDVLAGAAALLAPVTVPDTVPEWLD